MSNDFGGRMTLRLSTGDLLTIRGTVNQSSGRISVEGIANQDGSIDRSGTLVPGTTEVTLAANGVDLDAVLSGARFNATLIEDFTGVTHYYTNAFLTGKPVENRINGEVTGLTLNYEAYRKTNT